MCAMLLPALASAQVYAPSNWTGSVSYGYRMLSRGENDNSQGHLTTLGLNGSSYLGQPWLSTYNAGVNVTYDSSEYGDVDRNSGLVTGQLNLNLLPQSWFPTELLYLETDSRVDTDIVDLGGKIFTDTQDYHMRRFYARQSFIPTTALRVNGSYDNTTAESDATGEYQRTIASLYMGLRGGSHNLRSTFSAQDTTRTGSGISEDNRILSIDHQYYPNSSFVVTSLVSDVEVDRSIETTGIAPVQNLNHQQQLFSNFYWRPESKPFILNGGARVAQIQDEIAGTRLNDNGSATFSLSGVYQYSLRTSYSASVALYGSESDGEQTRTGTDQRLGVTYRSDTYGIGSYIYNWFADSSVGNSVVEDVQANTQTDSQNASATLGHGISRHWPFADGGGRFSLNVTQRASERGQVQPQIDFITGEKKADTFDDIQGLTHSVSAAWSVFTNAATSQMQASLSDVRDFEEEDTSSTFFNLQLSRVQSLSRNSSLNANITLQSYNQMVVGQGQGTLTTLSGMATYQQNRLLHISSLRYLSRLSLVEPDQDAASRGLEVYWDNQFNYDVGKLRSSLIWRVTGRDEDYVNSLFIRMTRSF